ncbi:hypothetical protein [Sideroxydans sp. CL21]|nr:hypothetical protein [Sideroxydans sp. CL21]
MDVPVVLFPRLTSDMAFPILLFDAETLINSSIKSNSHERGLN